VAISDAQLSALEAAIGRAAPGLSAERFLAELSGRAPAVLWHRLIDEVTVQETYFFRELREVEAIDWQQLLEEAMKSGFGVVRVWVVGCSTGEEAYSLAILASEALGREATPVTILGTDVSRAAIARAAAGCGYSERSIRNLPPRLRERYLLRDEERYRVTDGLKSLVRFRHHNLVADPAPPMGEVAFDAIACRNVLIYFDPPTVERALRSLEAALRPGGRLVLGAADRLGASGSLGRGLAVPPERRHPQAKRVLRRPLGLEPGPGEGAGPPAGPAANGGAEASRGPRRRAGDRIEDALLATDRGDLDSAREIVDSLLAADPLMVDAHFTRGLIELGSDDARAAIVSLRRSLYLDPSFGLAAFELGRAHEADGDPGAARRAYERALQTLDSKDGGHRAILERVDLGDVAAACAARLREESEGAR
jgi:chemotaxis methyl-accepting protein methylase